MPHNLPRVVLQWVDMRIPKRPSSIWGGVYIREALGRTSRMRGQRSGRVYVRMVWWRLRARLKASLSESFAYSSPNLVLFGLVAVAGHPLYYFLWHSLYPQPFESFWLRMVSTLFGIPMLFEPQFSKYQFFRRILPAYWLGMAVYQLPFFFVFMSLMNDFSTVWAMSTMAACLFLVLLVSDWLLVLLIAAVGTGAACFFFALTGHSLQTPYSAFAPLIPVYVFALCVGSIFNYKSEMVANEKLGAITAAVGTIAHELRTPLLGIRSGASGVRRYFPAILEGYELARQHGLPVSAVRSAHRREMHSVLERILTETEYSSVILDMLLINSSRNRIDRASFVVCRMSDCIASALERYPFQNGRQRAGVRWDRGVDFDFMGSSILMIHVLFNLLKNALYFLDRVADGHVYISAERAADGINRLRFLDTGPGIAPEELPRIFQRFYSGMPESQGTGIGLAFVRLVMHSFDGEIECRSELGRFTEFVMTFPAVGDYENN